MVGKGVGVTHVKVTASLPEELAKRIDSEAAKRGVSRSALLAEAADAHFRRQDREDFQAGIRAALAEQTDEDRAERDAWLAFARRQMRQILEGQERW
jgi:metal-responsive CopG/Arc/MetJ family transcriptional regulator